MIDPVMALKHLDTINKHKYHVMIHCFKAGIYWQGLTHDLSKYSPEEFFVSASMYQGTRSPNEGEREDKGYSLAWMHHKGHNKHHFEYWTDYDTKTKLMSPVKMPLIYVIEMFCDRVAASKVYNGDKYTDASPLAYFELGRGRRVIHPATSKLLEKLLIMLRDEGEERTFAYIRRLMREAMRTSK
ncbi:MAG: catalase [Oscillospiraceae bacterium]|nr:catalase [Oscillospiraceae bacterium]